MACSISQQLDKPLSLTQSLEQKRTLAIQETELARFKEENHKLKCKLLTLKSKM